MPQESDGGAQPISPQLEAPHVAVRIDPSCASLLCGDMPRIHVPELLAYLSIGALAIPLACTAGEESDPIPSWFGTYGEPTRGDSESASAGSESAGNQAPSDASTGGPTSMGDTDDTGPGAPANDSSDGEVPLHPCCAASEGPGCAADPDVEACVCATEEGESCCTEGWDEGCVAIMEHHECAQEATPCGGPIDAVPWDCSCTTTEVTCLDNPFVSQVTFLEDACATTHVEALADADAFCVSGHRNCMGAPGSCDCRCELDDPRPPNACEE